MQGSLKMSGSFYFNLSGYLLFNCWGFSTACSPESLNYQVVRSSCYGKVFFFSFNSSNKLQEVCAVCISVLVLFMNKAPKRIKTNPKHNSTVQKQMATNLELTNQEALFYLCIAQCFYTNSKDQVNHSTSQF